ncbi:MAG: gas vesicle protein GvpG [Deltaproteobacteria bacterium]|nr:gas vesicle protein GvpG [Deltaproteobacteria bacterium]MBL7173983.1 gas vesicle protein GvpG [Desulfobacteraceae bacterium]
MIPNISKNAAPVSQYIPLVSAVPQITLPRYWGLMPSWGWGETMKRWRRVRPVEKGLLRMLLRAPAAVPLNPLAGVTKLVKRVGTIAQEEMDREAQLKDAHLFLQMQVEMGEIAEEDYKTRIAEIDRKLEEIKGLSK